SAASSSPIRQPSHPGRIPMKREHLAALPAPGPGCARFAPVVPLAGHDLLSTGDAAALRKHAAGCTHCRALLDTYERLDAGLRRYFTTDISVPAHLTEAIVNHIEEQDNPMPLPTPVEVIPPALPHRRQTISALVAIAAMLLLAVLLQTV